MKKRILFTTLILTFSIVSPVIFCTYQHAQASYNLYDGKLILNGFVKEMWYIRTSMQDREKAFHDSMLDYANTSALFEALYTLKEEGDLTVRLFGGVKAWWEKSPMFDDELERSIPHRARKDYVHPRSFDDDMLTEAYVHIIKGPWELRVGKQIVIWGQLDMQRVADVVNPLDLRKGVPGVDTWEEIKQGIWMIRLLYTSQLPGNLLFEAIFNPGDFRNFQLPYEGTHYGAYGHVANPFGVDYGITHWLFEKMRRDAPGWRLSKNYEFGLKVRGFFWNVDWTLMYYDSLSDSPVSNPRRVGDFSFKYIQAAIGGGVPEDWPDAKVFWYKRFRVVGGTAQTYIQPLWSTVWRMEWAYQIGVPLNKGTGGESGGVYAWTRRDIVAFAVAVSKYLDIPKFTQSRIATGRQMSITLTYAWDKVLNHDHDLVLGETNHAYDHSVNDQISLFLQQEMFNSTIWFTFNGYYHFHTGKWMAVPTFTYIFPGIHWRADLGYAAFGGAKAKHVSHASATRDSIILRLRYEF